MPVNGSEAPDLQDIKGWINSESPLNKGTFLLDFWTYSCVNCIKMLSQLKKLDREYSDLNVVGVHTPEFKFEEEKKNVQKAVEKHGIKYPVALDSENSTWKAYGNRYWPRQTLLHDGEIIWQNIGEGSLKQVEQKIAELEDVEYKDLDLSHDQPSGEVSPEIYLGYGKSNGFNEEGNFGGEKKFDLPSNRKINQVYLQGLWRQEEEFLKSLEQTKMVLKYMSSAVNIVVHPEGGIRDIEILIDGGPVSKENAGQDIRIEDGRSYLRVKRPGVYSILDGGKGQKELELRPEENTRLYAFTFR